MKPLERAVFLPAPHLGELGKQYEENKEIWMNDVYTVQVMRGIPCPEISDELSIAWISIRRNDREPIFDWRDMQLIKNQLVGEQCEGVQLFPAEKRLVDNANQYHIYCFEQPDILFPFGFTDRMVTDDRLGRVPNTKQRQFPDEHTPADLAENNTLLKKELTKMGIEFEEPEK